MHDIRINATPSLLATIAARLPKDHQVEIRLSVDDSQFENLDLNQPVNQLLFATGKSSDELPTTIGAHDVAHIQGCNTTQSHLISAFFHNVGEPRPTQDRMDTDAIPLDDMTTQAVAFMLSLHEQYMDPTSDADEQELVDLAQQKGLTLDDYYRTSVAA